MVQLGLKVFVVSAALAVGVAAQTPAAAGLPVVSTTKVLAIGSITPEAMQGGMAPVRAILPAEVRATVKLYLAGKIDQWYVRTDKNGVVFVMNVGTVEEARSLLEKLPMGPAKVMEFELIPLGPLTPLALLIGPSAAPAPAGAK